MIPFTVDDRLREETRSPALIVFEGEARSPASVQDAVRAYLDRATTQARDRLAGGAPQLIPEIAAFRAELVRLGRNVSRYRISSEALSRRIAKGDSIPSISPLVDFNNSMSIETGWPAGCYEYTAIAAPVVYRLGTQDDRLDSLSKGYLDVARLPILADRNGPFGSAISDSVRTAIQPTSSAFVLVLYTFGEPRIDPIMTRVQEAAAAVGLSIRHSSAVS